MANDDLHFPDLTHKIAVRCNFLSTEGEDYEAVRKCLTEGGFYSMRIPDYGHGDWKVKHEMNRQLPDIREIGLEGSEIFIRLSDTADSIVVTGQDGRRLDTSFGCDSLRYRFRESDSYARLTAFFPGGEVIYSNPFARYDSSLSDSPFKVPEHRISVPLTILYNMMLLVLSVTLILAGIGFFSKQHEKKD